MAQDRIRLTGIRVFAHHGMYPEEQERGQEFLVDVDLRLDLSGAAAADDLAQTVDYGALAGRVHRLVTDERWSLIERVASRIADLVLEDQRVVEAEITVHKPAAPLAVPVDDVSVTINRTR